MTHATNEQCVARRVRVTGVVQGVGFRPFVYRLARELDIAGSVRNVAGSVEIEAVGTPTALHDFAARLRAAAPPRARVERVVVSPLHVDRQPASFTVEDSLAAPSAERLFPPDVATCDDCLRELFDPADRRYRYPFVNCTSCGPRATIIDELPYDRAQTSMHVFELCSACAAEYRDPANRRFHAEPVACPACGPSLAFRSSASAPASRFAEDALEAAVRDLRAGRVVALKGLGGYQLACDATDPDVVQRLRARKQRWAKPFAVMVRDLDAAHLLAEIDADEEAILTSPARPIVLLALRSDARPRLADAVLRGSPRVGLFLPYTPLHHLLLAEVNRPLVLTSGNRSDEPIVIDDAAALARLADVADSFLQHDREIRARYDDSVTRAVGGRESIVRRARGYAPEPLELPVPTSRPLLAVGAELKHTFTLASGARAYVSPHTGDLEDLATHEAFEHNLAHLARLQAIRAQVVVHDLHPAYLSTQYAETHFPADRRLAVQHHHAHVASCAAEQGMTGPFIGVAYDGLGMGDDGTFWGGEVLLADLAGYHRFARFGLAPMPGGAAAVRKPYRMALGYLLGVEGGTLIDPELSRSFLDRLDAREVEVVRRQVERRLNAPLASSAGRLFDAVSSLLGIRDQSEFEGEAAIALETAASNTGSSQPLPYALVSRGGLLVYDPRPTLEALLEGLADRRPTGELAARFQHTVVAVTLELCAAARAASGLSAVCLSGGVFQNHWLSGTVLARLQGEGFEAFINERVPVNDGGISYGQAAVAGARLSGLESRIAQPVLSPQSSIRPGVAHVPRHPR